MREILDKVFHGEDFALEGDLLTIGVLDRTLTSMGARKLRHWILHPLLDVAAINERLLNTMIYVI